MTPAWMQAAEGDVAIPYSAQQDRAGVLEAMFSREGVYNLRGGDLKVTQRSEGANFTVDVAIGRAAIRGDDTSDQGTYVVTNTTKANLTIPAAPASGSRTHRIVLRVRDKVANSSWTVYDAVLAVLPDPGTGVPDEPASAITLAYVTVAAGAGSVTNAMIADKRSRSSVGTAAIEGTMGALNPGFLAGDSTRPLKWTVNPDGWVQLSGWVRWNTTNSAVAPGEQRTMGGTPLSDPAIKPPGIRDFPGTSIFGPVHLAVFPNGAIYFRFQQAITLVNGSWFSFDGCFYRI